MLALFSFDPVSRGLLSGSADLLKAGKFEMQTQHFFCLTLSQDLLLCLLMVCFVFFVSYMHPLTAPHKILVFFLFIASFMFCCVSFSSFLFNEFSYYFALVKKLRFDKSS